MHHYKQDIRYRILKLQTGFIVIAIGLAISLLSDNIGLMGNNSGMEPEFQGFNTINITSFKR